MDTRPLLEQARDRFAADRHLIDVTRGEWITMVDDRGRELEGIRGRAGAAGVTVEGHEIGADLIEMQPGASFPLHVHPGDHILFGHSGAGNVLIEGERRLIYPGVTVFVAAEYEHGVGTYRAIDQMPVGYARAKDAWRSAGGVFTLLAIGVPHEHVGADTRMTLVEHDHRHG